MNNEEKAQVNFVKKLLRLKSMDEFHVLLQSDPIYKSFYTPDLSKIPATPIGGGNSADPWHNSQLIECTTDQMNALNERLTNAHDAVADRWNHEGRFHPQPKNRQEAVIQMAGDSGADHGGVYFIVSRDTGVANILDTGIGVRSQDFLGTMMTTGTTGKHSKEYSIGGYGYGASTSYHFTDLTIVATISILEPEIVTVGAVFKIMHGDWPSYVCLTAPDGSPLTVKLPPEDRYYVTTVKSLRACGAKLATLLHEKLILGDSGTLVRLIGFRWPPATKSSKQELWCFLRDRLFGNLTDVHLFYPDAAQGHEYERTKGLRDVLMRNSPNTVEVIYPQEPHGIMTLNGRSRARLSLWVVNWKRDPKTGNYKKAVTTESKRRHDLQANTPISSILTQRTSDTPIFITRNGQTYARLPLRSILKNVNLTALIGKVIIEINLDDMTGAERSNFLPSNREQITRDMRDIINAEIIKFLKEDSALKELANRIRADDFRNHTPENVQFDETFLQQLMSSAGGNNIFDGFGEANDGIEKLVLNKGKPSITGIEGVVSRAGKYSGGKGGDEATPIDLKETPTVMIAVNKETITIGRDEYFTVITDAAENNAGLFDLDFSEAPFLLPASRNHTKGLKEGRESFRISCRPDTKPGEKGALKVSLLTQAKDGKFVTLEAVWYVTAIKAVKVDPTKKTLQKQGRRAMPKLDPVDVAGVNDELWDHIEAGNLSERDVAFNYELDESSNTLSVYVNTKFPPLLRAQNLLQREDNPEDFKQEYYNLLGITAMTYLDGKLEADDGDRPMFTVDGLHLTRAACAKAALLQTLRSLEAKREPHQTFKAASALEEAEAGQEFG